MTLTLLFAIFCLLCATGAGVSAWFFYNKSNILAAEKAEEIEQKQCEVEGLRLEVGELRMAKDTLREEKEALNLAKVTAEQAMVAKLAADQGLLALAKEALEQQREQVTKDNKEALQTQVSPLLEEVKRFKSMLDTQNTEHIKGRQQLQGMVKSLEERTDGLGEEARQLSQALRSDSQARGSWGEQALEQLLQHSGLVNHEHYEAQYQAKDEDGRSKRPDFLIKLPYNKAFIIDSKVTLVSWMALETALNSDEPQAEAVLEKLKKKFESDVYTRVEELASKEYTKLPNIDTLDVCFLYMPLESADIYLRQHTHIHQRAIEKKRVIILSAANLVPVLSLLNYIWSQHHQQLNVTEIMDEVSTLLGTVEKFFEYMEKVEKGLDQARKAYDAAQGRLYSGRNNVMRHSRRIIDMGVRQTELQNRINQSDLPEGSEDLVPRE